jgi:hypothetical protein
VTEVADFVMDYCTAGVLLYFTVYESCKIPAG